MPGVGQPTESCSLGWREALGLGYNSPGDANVQSVLRSISISKDPERHLGTDVTTTPIAPALASACYTEQTFWLTVFCVYWGQHGSMEILSGVSSVGVRYLQPLTLWYNVVI